MATDAAEPDMSWIDIAIDRSGEALILDYAPGWADFVEDWLVCDVFKTDAEFPAKVGAYRWSNYRIGSWEEGDHAVVIGGSFAPLPAAPAA